MSPASSYHVVFSYGMAIALLLSCMFVLIICIRMIPVCIAHVQCVPHKLYFSTNDIASKKKVPYS